MCVCAWICACVQFVMRLTALHHQYYMVAQGRGLYSEVWHWCEASIIPCIQYNQHRLSRHWLPACLVFSWSHVKVEGKDGEQKSVRRLAPGVKAHRNRWSGCNLVMKALHSASFSLYHWFNICTFLECITQFCVIAIQGTPARLLHHFLPPLLPALFLYLVFVIFISTFLFYQFMRLIFFNYCTVFVTSIQGFVLPEFPTVE